MLLRRTGAPAATAATAAVCALLMLCLASLIAGKTTVLQLPPYDLDCTPRQPQSGAVRLELHDEQRDRVIVVEYSLPEQQSAPAPLLVAGPGTGESIEGLRWIDANKHLAVVRVTPWHDPIYHACELTVDLHFVAREFCRQSRTDTRSPLYGRLTCDVVFGGHSMTGGAAMTAIAVAPSDIAVAGYIGLGADAFTNPWDAGGAFTAPNVTVPALIISGTHDCFSPIAWNSERFFKLFSSPRKAHVVLIGADHDHHTQPVCEELAEFEAMEQPYLRALPPGCQPALSGAEQRALDIQLVDAFSAYLLASSGSSEHERTAWSAFEQTLAEGAARGRWLHTTSVHQSWTASPRFSNSTCRCAVDREFAKEMVTQQLLLTCYDAGCSRMRDFAANEGQVGDGSAQQGTKATCSILPRISRGTPPLLFDAFGDPLPPGSGYYGPDHEGARGSRQRQQ